MNDQEVCQDVGEESDSAVHHRSRHRMCLARRLVRVDGVEAGFVREVTLEANRGNRPIVVRMALDTTNRLSVPSDATASLQVDGVLGPTFVEVDTRNRTGALVSNNGILESVEAVDNTGAAHALEVIGNTLLDQSKKLREKENSNSESPKSKQ